MGRSYKMSWRGHPYYDWRKTYRGEEYRVTCEELNAPLPTAEASYRLANAWWEGKLAELNKPDPATELLNRYQTQDLLDKVAQGRAAEAMLLAMKVDKQRQAEEVLRSMQVSPETLRTMQVSNISATETMEKHFPMEKLIDVAEKADGKPVEKSKRLGHQVERFLTLEKARGKSQLTFFDLRNTIHKAMECPAIKPEMDIGEIDAKTISTFYSWVRLDSGMAESSQHKCFSYFRRVIKFLWEEGLIELPKNLHSRQFSFDRSARAIKVYSVSDVKDMLGWLPDKLRLYALLSLNCAMLGVDMGTLEKREWQGDRIIRKRTKTRKHKSVPVVNYLLWTETQELLAKFTSDHPIYVLASKTGTPLWRDKRTEGRVKEAEYRGNGKTDLIKSHWEKHKPKPPMPLKALRSHAADQLKEGGYSLQIQQVFLCHAPTTIAERHYVNYSQKTLDEAITWLRGQYFG